MKQLRALCFFITLCCIAIPVRAEEETSFKFYSQNETGIVEYDTKTGTVVLTNGAVVSYSNVVLTADSAVANERTGEVVAEGNVTIKGHGVLWQGDRISYNFKTAEMQSAEFKTGQNPFFIKGQGLMGDRSNQTYTATNAIITTDDYADPAYKIRTRSLTIVPNKYFEAREVTLLIGDVPVFYFPYYRRAIGHRVNHFDFTPGYRSKFGAFLLTTYNWYWEDKIDAALHMDYRTKRGVAAGPEIDYRFGKFGDGNIEYYYAQDDKPGRDFRTNSISEDRHRIAFSHLTTIRTNLTVKAVANYQSDSYVDRDFFESEYRRNVQPKSFLEVNQLWSNFSLDIFAQPQVNDFQETVERLPDLKLTAFRQQLGNTPLYYEGENSLGYFNRRFIDHSTNFAAMRADSFHQIVLPHTFFGWLNVTPRVGGRLTYYGESEGRGATTDEELRNVFNTGAEVSFKSSRVWAGAENKLLDVRGLRHIIEPSLNYAFVPRPSVRPRDLPQFDYEMNSLRTLPIDFPQYNAIDSIDSRNVVRFGLRNLLQTKREERIETLVHWSLFTDWRIDPGIDHTTGTRTNRSRQSTFAPLTSSLDFQPRSWMTIQSDMRYDLNDDILLESHHQVVLEPNNVWSVSFGHRYLDEHRENGSGPGNNLFRTSFYYRANENWATRISHHFEARDGTLEEQYYTIYRDLRSWTAAFTVRVRDNRDGTDDLTVALTLSLKAFPRFGLNSDRDRPSLLVGY